MNGTTSSHHWFDVQPLELDWSGVLEAAILPLLLSFLVPLLSFLHFSTQRSAFYLLASPHLPFPSFLPVPTSPLMFPLLLFLSPPLLSLFPPLSFPLRAFHLFSPLPLFIPLPLSFSLHPSLFSLSLNFRPISVISSAFILLPPSQSSHKLLKSLSHSRLFPFPSPNPHLISVPRCLQDIYNVLLLPL